MHHSERANHRARHDTFAMIVEVLSGKAGFNAELSVDDATGIAYAVQSEETYQLLVREHGWSVERWRRWALDTLAAQLYPATRGARRPGRAGAR